MLFVLKTQALFQLIKYFLPSKRRLLSATAAGIVRWNRSDSTASSESVDGIESFVSGVGSENNTFAHAIEAGQKAFHLLSEFVSMNSHSVTDADGVCGTFASDLLRKFIADFAEQLSLVHKYKFFEIL